GSSAARKVADSRRAVRNRTGRERPDPLARAEAGAPPGRGGGDPTSAGSRGGPHRMRSPSWEAVPRGSAEVVLEDDLFAEAIGAADGDVAAHLLLDQPHQLQVHELQEAEESRDEVAAPHDLLEEIEDAHGLLQAQPLGGAADGVADGDLLHGHLVQLL